MTTEYVETRMIPLDDLTPFPGNARRGDVGLILASLRRNSQYRPLVVREHQETGDLVILAGNHTYLGLLRHRDNPGDCDDDCALCSAGYGSAALCGILRCDDDTAVRINLVDNRASDTATYDDSDLLALLSRLSDADDWPGSGYGPDDYTSLSVALDEPGWKAQQEAEVLATREPVSAPETASGEGPGPATALQRTVPLDAMFCCRFNSIALAAYEMGFLPGMISSKKDAWRKIFDKCPGIRIGLMDNEWHDYDHAAHVEGVREARPKYATVRDVMTKAQCEAAGVEFIPLERILEMAEEVAEYADEVIVIPKYDCLDKIPERYVIGFSVPTSYGGTPMPASLLQGRRVHLLGGSWRNQRSYLDVLGQDVVSLDNNHLLRVSEFGDFTLPDGTRLSLRNLDPRMPRTWQAAAILSLASIRDELNQRYGAGVGRPDEDHAPQTSPERSGDADTAGDN